MHGRIPHHLISVNSLPFLCLAWKRAVSSYLYCSFSISSFSITIFPHGSFSHVYFHMDLLTWYSHMYLPHVSSHMYLLICIFLIYLPACIFSHVSSHTISSIILQALLTSGPSPFTRSNQRFHIGNKRGNGDFRLLKIRMPFLFPFQRQVPVIVMLFQDFQTFPNGQIPFAHQTQLCMGPLPPGILVMGMSDIFS